MRPALKQAKQPKRISQFQLSALCVRRLVAALRFIRRSLLRATPVVFQYLRVRFRLRRKLILLARRLQPSPGRVSLCPPKHHAPTMGPCRPWIVRRVPRRPSRLLRRCHPRALIRCPLIWLRRGRNHKPLLQRRRPRLPVPYLVRPFQFLRAPIRGRLPAPALHRALPLRRVRKARATWQVNRKRAPSCRQGQILFSD